MLVAIYPLVFVVLGLLLYAFWTPHRTVGLVVFAASFLVLMEVLSKHTLRIG
jgi:hypothetical protein